MTTLPTWEKLYKGRAGTFWNCLCCPFVGAFGLIWRSIHIYAFPCCTVMCQRLAINVLWRYACFWFRWPYQDEEFFGAAALGDHDGESGAQMNRQTDWIRAHQLQQFQGKNPQLFEGEIEPSDLCQGAVGDCWLVAAFACASEFPDMIRHMFLTKEYNPRGLYKIRIFDPQQERWKVVVVDDRIPCKKGSTSPRFMKPNGNELWAIILEKAYAKHCGSYANLSGGFVLWAWLSMTGHNVFQLSLDTKGGITWCREDMKATKNPQDRRACGFSRTKEKYGDDEIWTLLRKYDSRKALISASIGKRHDRIMDGPAGEQMLEKEGLVAGHAYSIISAMEVRERIRGVPKPDGKSFKLLRLRNPWGSYEWKGKWSDKSKLWKKYKSIAKQVGHTLSDDGSFWMSFSDFKMTFSTINVCDRDTMTDASLNINEDNGSCGIIQGFCCGCVRFWCLCQGLRNLYFSHESTEQTLGTDEGKCCWIC
jgi:Calpain family cysteine protease